MAVFNAEYVFNDCDRVELSNVEKDICRYIAENCQDDYDSLISKDDRWKVLYHLTRMRKSLLNWYVFKENSVLLEIGGAFGALTGLFCDKCKQVVSIERFLNKAEQIYERHKHRDNLTVYAGRIEDIPLTEKFDYITVIGVLEYIKAFWNSGNNRSVAELCSEYLSELRRLLKPDGKILLAVENRYGLKYFCGAPEPHTGIPFSGINGYPERYPEGYPEKVKGYSFSKRELIRIIEGAGFPFYKFYFPLPDYKLPQLIYSQDYIPESSIRERVLPYYQDPSSLLAYENDIYDDIIENNVFDFFSNSFLVECSASQELCNVVYAAVSTDRGKEESFTTTIHSDWTVRKTPLYPEGMKQLKTINKNHMELKSRGLKVIDSGIIDSSLLMPYIKHDTLSDHLKKIIRSDQKQFIHMFDKLLECILQSSEHVRDGKNDMQCRDSTADFGIILEKAYIDMIPINCFYDGCEFIFFDQEFVKEYYPAKYVLFRALKYTYYFIQDADEYVPLNDLRARYGLEELWEIFEQEEYAFVSANRKYDEHESFFTLVKVDKEHMYENAKLLLR